MSSQILAGAKVLRLTTRHALIVVPELKRSTAESIGADVCDLADALLEKGLELVWAQPPHAFGMSEPRFVVRFNSVGSVVLLRGGIG